MVQAYEPLAESTSDSEFVTSYINAYELLDSGNSEAEKHFALLHERYPDDPLVKLHYSRIREGEISTIITMTDK